MHAFNDYGITAASGDVMKKLYLIDAACIILFYY